MEFDEMKMIWDAQNNERLYAIDEKALFNRILAKENQAGTITNVSELLWIIGNFLAGALVLFMSLQAEKPKLILVILGGWMLLTAIYVLANRLRRLGSYKDFERSMHGHLAQAISLASYQVRFSQLGRWNILPIAGICIVATLDSGKSLWWVAGFVVFFLLAFFGSGWEHNIYKKRKAELVGLKARLESGD